MAALKKNTFKVKLQAGRLRNGLWCTMNDSLVFKKCTSLGYARVLFDTAHSALDPLSVLPRLQTVAAYPASPIVRPGSLNPAETKKLPDLDAQNILVPMIQDAGEAGAAVAAVEYPRPARVVCPA